MFQNWSSVLTSSFHDIGYGVIDYVPNIIVAILIFLVGWIVGSLVGKLVAQIFRTLKVDQALRHAGLEDVTRRAGYNLNSGLFVGTLVKWFIVVAFLVAALDALHLTEVTFFLRGVVLGYLPQVIVAVLILLVAVVIADVMSRVVTASARAAGLRSANLFGSVTKWAIWIFAVLTALTELQIATGIIMTLFTGFVVALSLAFGLAFGLGGQNAAAQAIEKLKRDIADHQL